MWKQIQDLWSLNVCVMSKMWKQIQMLRRPDKHLLSQHVYNVRKNSNDKDKLRSKNSNDQSWGLYFDGKPQNLHDEIEEI